MPSADSIQMYNVHVQHQAYQADRASPANWASPPHVIDPLLSP